jgi:phosphoglycolate phosphatase
MIEWSKMMHKKFQAVLFDLDGTLLDTVDSLAAAVNRMLIARGFPVHPVDAYRHFVGEGASVLVHRALPPEARTDTTEKECLSEYLADYGQNWLDGVHPYPGIVDMLKALVSVGIRMAVLSNKPHDITQKCVSHFFSNWPFEVVLGQREHIPKKPDPTGALEVATSMKLPESTFIYLGDTAIDMKTARAADMFSAGVSWGFRPEELMENGAGIVIDHPKEIHAILSQPPDTD